jgi:hypothetical protein
MLGFIDTTYGPQAIFEAWDEFTLWDDEEKEFSPDTPHLPLFLPWFFHCWAPDPRDTSITDASLHRVAPTQAFLARKGRQLDPILHEYLEACTRSPFSFFEVLQNDPGRGFRLRELFSETEFDVVERTASRSLQSSDTFYGQISATAGTCMLEACAPVVIPPIRKIAVLELRKKLRSKHKHLPYDSLRDWDPELRELYLDLAEELLYPEMPQFANTDGEPLSLRKLIFDIDSAQQAFDALKYLAGEESDASLLADAERDADGNLRRVQFCWNRPGTAMNPGLGNTILAHIEIDRLRLTLDVNSEKRAVAARRAVEKALGEHARWRAMEIQSVEKMLADSPADRASFPDADLEAFNNLPEVRARLSELLEEHYKSWIHEKIPALGGKTPKQAMRSASGRERVEALVQQIERDGMQMSPPLDEGIVRRLRERLGLTN